MNMGEENTPLDVLILQGNAHERRKAKRETTFKKGRNQRNR